MEVFEFGRMFNVLRRGTRFSTSFDEEILLIRLDLCLVFWKLLDNHAFETVNLIFMEQYGLMI